MSTCPHCYCPCPGHALGCPAIDEQMTVSDGTQVVIDFPPSEPPRCPVCGGEMAVQMVEHPSGHVCLHCNPPDPSTAAKCEAILRRICEAAWEGRATTLSDDMGEGSLTVEIETWGHSHVGYTDLEWPRLVAGLHRLLCEGSGLSFACPSPPRAARPRELPADVDPAATWRPASELPQTLSGLVWWWEPGLERPYFLCIVTPREGKPLSAHRRSTTGWWRPLVVPPPPTQRVAP